MENNMNNRAAGGETLPRWNLADLYPGRTAPAIEADLQQLTADTTAFAARWQGQLANADGAALAEALEAYERIDEGLSKLMSYAGLVYAEATEDADTGRFYQTVTERVTDISTALVFFSLELNRIDETRLQRELQQPALARWKPWLEAVRAFREHQLSDEAERLLHERHVVGAGAWNRLFDQSIAGLRFPIGGAELPISDALNLLTDGDAAKRREAALAIGLVLDKNARTFALITSTLAKDKQIDDAWRSYPRPTSARNLGNQVEDDVVDALVAAVRSSYPRLAHRYYALKARWMGVERLDWWDRNAPLPEDGDRNIPWAQAKDIVLQAYGSFAPQLAEIAGRFFDRGWIDAAPVPGKDPGAFAHPTVPSVHPYVLLNYHGRLRDVMTLAHELGHGVHQVLAGGRGHLLSQTPLTLAETASVFGEMLTFRSLLDRETDPAARRRMLAGKVEDMLNTVVRQIAFHDFESRVHAERQNGELTPEQLGDIWMAVQSESLGPALRFDDAYRSYWAYIPHFIHSPFYVYAYAFGDCLVNALYAVYREQGEGFTDRYFELLAAGGTKRHRELLAPFGLDASDPAFWNRGLDVISGFIDELEAAG
jgi:oligoendopeptidase F